MKGQIPTFLLTTEPRSLPSNKREASYNLPFIDRTLRKTSLLIKAAYIQMDTAKTHGLMQGIDARIKMLFLLLFVVQANILQLIHSQLWLFIFLLVVITSSRLNLRDIYKKILLFSFFFGFIVIAPAALNLATEGQIVLYLFRFTHPYHVWIYHIPADIGITREGLLVVARLYLKVFNSITVTLLVFYTTSFHEIIKALKIFKVPGVFLLIMMMTYKFIFILAHTVQETYFALKLRWWKKVKHHEANNIIAGRMAYIFRKSWHRYEEVYSAMLARGFTGEVTVYYIREIKAFDYWFLMITATISITIYLN